MRFLHLVGVAATDLLGVEVFEAQWHARIADVQEIGPQATDQDFDQGLAYRGCCQGVAETNELIQI